jgi:chromosome partitioning protein
MATTIAFLNYKGGVGKSTSTVNVAKALHDLGKRVLVIDADSQGNASKMMGKKLSEANNETLYEVMSRGMDILNCICMDQDREDSFDYVPSNQNLVYAEMELVSRISRESILRKALAPAQNHYDYILIDCTPTDGLISQNAIAASDYIIVPLNGEPFALDGMGKIIQRYREVKEGINPNLQILGYLFTLMRKCSLHDSTRESLRQLRDSQQWPGDIFDTEIKQNVCFAESASCLTNIFDYADSFNGKSIQDRSKRESAQKAAAQYRALAEEIINKLNR